MSAALQVREVEIRHFHLFAGLGVTGQAAPGQGRFAVALSVDAPETEGACA